MSSLFYVTKQFQHACIVSFNVGVTPNDEKYFK